MEITINQQLTKIPENHSVEALLSGLFQNPGKGIAVAINQSIVPRSEWPTRLLIPADKVTLITATQGG